MGLLRSLLLGQQVAPQMGQTPSFAPTPPPPPPLPPGVVPTVAQMPNTSPVQFNPTLGQRISSGFNGNAFGIGNGGGFNGMDALQMGMSLMGAGQRGGGGWSQAAQSFGDIRNTAQQRQRTQRADQRDDTIFGRQQTQWGQEDQTRAAWEAEVTRLAQTDPAAASRLRALGPEAYAEWTAGEQQRAFAAQQQTNQQQFQSREGQLDRDATLRAAQVRSANENNLGRYFQQMDAGQIGELNQQAAQLQAVGLPQLRQLRSTIGQAGTALTGRPVDYNDRITLGRLFNGSSQDRQTLEVWRAQILGPALETLRGLGAMSEREMEAAVNSFSNPNMTLGAAMQLIDEKISTAERRVSTAQATSEFFQSAGGLTGVTNPAGQDYATFLAERLGATPGAGGEGAGDNLVPRGGFTPPPQAAVAELRRDTSAAARAEFDQTFGPGAAARALASGGGRPSRATQAAQTREGARAYRNRRWEVYRGGRWVPE